MGRSRRTLFVLAIGLAIGVVGCEAGDAGSASETLPEEMSDEVLEERMTALRDALESELELLEPIWELAQTDPEASLVMTPEQLDALKRTFTQAYRSLDESGQEATRTLNSVVSTNSPLLSEIPTWFTSIEDEGEQKALVRLLLPWLEAYANIRGVVLPWNQIAADMQYEDEDEPSAGKADDPGRGTSTARLPLKLAPGSMANGTMSSGFRTVSALMTAGYSQKWGWFPAPDMVKFPPPALVWKCTKQVYSCVSPTGPCFHCCSYICLKPAFSETLLPPCAPANKTKSGTQVPASVKAKCTGAPGWDPNASGRSQEQ